MCFTGENTENSAQSEFKSGGEKNWDFNMIEKSHKQCGRIKKTKIAQPPNFWGTDDAWKNPDL